jgi:hypothetical protein
MSARSRNCVIRRLPTWFKSAFCLLVCAHQPESWGTTGNGIVIFYPRYLLDTQNCLPEFEEHGRNPGGTGFSPLCKHGRVYLRMRR